MLVCAPLPSLSASVHLPPLLMRLYNAIYAIGGRVGRCGSPASRTRSPSRLRPSAPSVWHLPCLGGAVRLNGGSSSLSARVPVRCDAVDPRDRCACHLRWRGSGSGSPLRAAENADVLFNYRGPYTHTTSLWPPCRPTGSCQKSPQVPSSAKVLSAPALGRATPRDLAGNTCAHAQVLPRKPEVK